MRKIVGLLAVAATCALAEINISGIEAMEGSATFRDKVFNDKVRMPAGCITVKEAFNHIEKETGLRVLNKTLLDEKAPVCNLDKFEITGRVMEAIVRDQSKIFFVEQEGMDTYIVVTGADKSVTTFPMYWDTAESKTLLNKEFPKIKWTFYGNVIKAEGSKADLKAAEPTLEKLREYASRIVPVKIKISDVEAMLPNKEFMNRVQIIGRLSASATAEGYNAQVAHGNGIQIKEVPVPIKFDLQNNRVSMGNVSVPIEELNNVAFLFGNKQISLDFGSLFYNGPKY